MEHGHTGRDGVTRVKGTRQRDTPQGDQTARPFLSRPATAGYRKPDRPPADLGAQVRNTPLRLLRRASPTYPPLYTATPCPHLHHATPPRLTQVPTTLRRRATPLSTPTFMVSMELPRSLVELPNEILALIVGRVAVTSTRPMEDLRSLRATCKAMHRPCRDRDVGRRLVLHRVRVKQMQEEDPAGYDVFVRNLAACGNLEACFLTGMDDIFGRNRSPRPPLEQLHRAAAAGHKMAATVFLYRANNGNDTNATAMEYMKQVEFEDGLKWRPRFIPNAYTMDIRPYAEIPPRPGTPPADAATGGYARQH
ncbi:hypothetical protein HU200_059985 [Digitaria exilis]|uniref:F-box domain-containing protein n=1 Tax=Digitaria exilis TaxID=1010633 RepID=A0A835DZC4_9POAL|nr:hypothetical protein HU200_059985 [Digitaria exilis]